MSHIIHGNGYLLLGMGSLSSWTLGPQTFLHVLQSGLRFGNSGPPWECATWQLCMATSSPTRERLGRATWQLSGTLLPLLLYPKDCNRASWVSCPYREPTAPGTGIMRDIVMLVRGPLWLSVGYRGRKGMLSGLTKSIEHLRMVPCCPYQAL